ncbi:MAG: heme exporter protein CcmD [Proteobacteria bacterium]|nr:heme exporter protein CcmD [Pseudomonadota bacterium]
MIYWNSLSDFLAMGNHGLYVWGSFIVMALAMILEPILLVRGRRNLIARLKRQIRAEKLDRKEAH